jgi:hypothetical protein
MATSRLALAFNFLVSLPLLAAHAAAADAAGESSKHFGALSKLSVAVAQAMPADQYSFRPHPESMDFGQLMSHMAPTNRQFCAGLKDAAPPSLPSPPRQGCRCQAPERFLRLLFRSDSGPHGRATQQIARFTRLASSRAGNPARDVRSRAHQLWQAEIYLRDKGIKPPWRRCFAPAYAKTQCSTPLVPGHHSSVLDCRHGSKGALRVTGEVGAGGPFPYSGVMFVPGPSPMDVVNLSSKKTISFWATGDGKTYAVAVLTEGNAGGVPAIKPFVAGPEWKQYSFPMSTFQSDGTDIRGLAFARGQEPGSSSSKSIRWRSNSSAARISRPYHS